MGQNKMIGHRGSPLPGSKMPKDKWKSLDKIDRKKLDKKISSTDSNVTDEARQKYRDNYDEIDWSK